MISEKGQLKISNVCYEHISTKFAMYMNPSTAEKTSHWIAGLISILSKVIDLNYIPNFGNVVKQPHVLYF